MRSPTRCGSEPAVATGRRRWTRLAPARYSGTPLDGVMWFARVPTSASGAPVTTPSCHTQRVFALGPASSCACGIPRTRFPFSAALGVPSTRPGSQTLHQHHRCRCCWSIRGCSTKEKHSAPLPPPPPFDQARARARQPCGEKPRALQTYAGGGSSISASVPDICTVLWSCA